MQSLPVLRSGALRGRVQRSAVAGVRHGAVRRPGSSGLVRRMVFLVVGCVLAGAAVLFAGATPAGAHAALLGSDPKQGTVVPAPPSAVSLTFSEQVTMGDDAVRVLDPTGRRVSTGKATDGGSDTYRIRLRTGLPDGTYTVAYQVVSADSHPVSGAFTFSVGAPSATSVSVPGDTSGGGVVGGLYDTARYVAYAGFILLVGGAAFVLACWPRGAGVRPVQRLVVAGWVAMTAATLALLLMRGAYIGSGKVADIVDLGLLGDVLRTKAGTALVSRLLLLAVAALFVAVLFGVYARRIGADASVTGGSARGVPDGDGDGDGGGGGGGGGKGEEEEAGGIGGDVRDGGAEDTAATGHEDTDSTGPGDTDAAGRGGDAGGGKAAGSDLAFGLAVGGVVVAIGLAATWALSEHASAGLQTRLAMPVDVVHLLAVAAWLGGLAALLTALFRVPAIEVVAVRRFSALAFGSVLTLVATGLYQSWRQVGSWSALTETSFGQLLLVKVGLIAVVVVIASSSRRWTGRLVDGAAAGDKAAVAPAESTTSATIPMEADPGVEPGLEPGVEAGVEADRAPMAPSPTPVSGTITTTATATASKKVTDPAAADTCRVTNPADTGTVTNPADTGTVTNPADDARDTTTAAPSPERAAQLARQQAAKDAARRRRTREADPARSALRRSVLAEAVVAVAVLAVTTVLTTTETGRTQEAVAHAGGTAATAQRPTPPVSFTLPYHTDGGAHAQGSVMLDVTPSHPGANDLLIMVMDPHGKAVDIPEVKTRLTLTAEHIGPLNVPLQHTSVGNWIAKGVQIPMAGDWRFDLTVRTSDIDQVTVHKKATIG